MDFNWFGTPLIYEYYYENWIKSYLMTLYIGFYLVGVAEVCPRTAYETILAMNILMLGSILNGIIIGNMAVQMTQLYQKKKNFNQKMDTINSAINTLELN